jgi:hypothetical protein
MDPSQDPIFNMSLNAQIIAALLGGNFVALVSDFGPLSVPPTEPLSEPSSDPSTEPPTSPLAHRRRFQEDPPEDEPPAKYARYHENEKPIDYSVIELNTCLIMRFTEEDGKTLLLNEDLLPNRFVRNIISKIPLSVKDRMNYLARFRQNDAESVSYTHLTLPTSP